MDLFALHFIARHENIAFSGPVGVGKTYLAQALGHAACRAGYRVLLIRTDALLKALASSRADNSFDRELRRFIAPDLVVIDDFGLRKLSGQASSDFYDLVVERHTRASTIITSNRSVEEWMAVFDEPLLGQSALDRFCHRAHQFVIDGESYRRRTAPSGKSESQKLGSRLPAAKASGSSSAHVDSDVGGEELVKKQERKFRPVGRACGNCRNSGQKQNATLLLPTVAWISRAIKRARLIHSYHQALPMIYPTAARREQQPRKQKTRREACHR